MFLPYVLITILHILFSVYHIIVSNFRVLLHTHTLILSISLPTDCALSRTIRNDDTKEDRRARVCVRVNSLIDRRLQTYT